MVTRMEDDPVEDTPSVAGPEPVGITALRLIAAAKEAGAGPLVHIAPNRAAAQRLQDAIAALGPGVRSTWYPAWDCFPYDRAAPSRAMMGRRMGVLRWLTDGQSPPDIVVTTLPALMQRVPPRAVWQHAHASFRTGDALDPDAAAAELERLGYLLDDRVDEPGEAAIHGKVIDLFPAAADMPCRIEHEDGVITGIRSYDPVSQRTEADAAVLAVDPASEAVRPRDSDAARCMPGEEHWLPDFYPALESFFDYAPDARLTATDGLAARIELLLGQIAEARDFLLDLRRTGQSERSPVSIERFFLTAGEWQAILSRPAAEIPPLDFADVPVFAHDRRPGAAMREYVEEAIAAGCRVVLAGPADGLAPFGRRYARAFGEAPAVVADWDAALKAGGGPVLLAAPLDASFRLPKLVVIAAADLLGPRAHEARAVCLPDMDEDFRIGDAVVHREHGVGVLEGLETVGDAASCGAVEAIRLRYAGDASRLVPLDEIGLLWRYGAAADAVTLDRLDGRSWADRRATVEAGIARAAEALAERVRRRRSREAPVLKPPRRAFDRFAARFRYPLTAGQAAATEAVLDDLAAGHPMDRLVCGDVGYGKTEVALLAAAAVALSGKQVAIAAPTTVLVQQHLRTFTRRFAGFGIEVAQLSRLAGAAGSRKVKRGLAEGRIGVVVGTHALASKDVRFADLGLVVIDEEQRFGTAHKEKLHALADGVHMLRLTATPIPRTLQASLVGLQDLSLIATPPVERQPIRTVLAPFDAGAVRVALMRERQRGGQSFVVCPRIADIAPMAARLRAIVPELDLVVAHGRMPVAEIDAAMVGFADGAGDVLLATNIIESGLDVPNANTMLVWRPDRFGLAQLHQLRGRVGRAARRGTAYLLTDPARRLQPATEKRLRTLESLTQLGAGFEISSRDLDQRGAGDLMGDEQAGHMKMIGTGLYRHLLQCALSRMQGEPVGVEWLPEVNLGLHGRLPEEYVPDDEVRLNLYVRLGRLEDGAAVAAFADELDDRFGDLPPEAEMLLALVRIGVACRKRGICRLDGGPEALAASFRPEVRGRIRVREDERLCWKGDRLRFAMPSRPDGRLAAATAFLKAIRTA